MFTDSEEELELLPEILELISETNSDREDGITRANAGYIKWIQASLNKILRLRISVDGVMGPATRSAIRSFQSQKRLTVDGKVGPNTESVLIKAGAELPPIRTSASSEITNEIVEGIGLGLAVFQLGQSLTTSGDFSVQSSSVSYVHENTPTSRVFRNAELDFRLIAHHPRYFVDPQNLWFKLTYEYNGNDIRNARIVGLRDRSSSLFSSEFTINFNGDKNSVPQDPIAEIVFNISGKWDPVGRGDVSFWGVLYIKADGSNPRISVSSELDWVRVDRFYAVIPPKSIATLNQSQPTQTTRQATSSISLGPPLAVTLKRGSRGDSVKYLQKRINDWAKKNNQPFNLLDDGNFGNSTEQAIRAFQRWSRLKNADGIVGTETWTAINRI